MWDYAPLLSLTCQALFVACFAPQQFQRHPRKMFSALGPLSILFNRILNLIEKLISPTASRKNNSNTETKTHPQE
jgi:hypothetical protein